MITKLPFTQIHSGGEDMVDRVKIQPVAPYEMQHKINELVCATNEIQKQIDCINCAMLDLATPDGENKALNALLKNKEKKALEIAINILKEIDKTRSVCNHNLFATDKELPSGNCFCWTTPDEIHNAIEQINAIIKGE